MSDDHSEILAAFLAELTALLRKWGAELEAKDHYLGYPECGEDIRITAWIPADGADVEIDLGDSFDGTLPTIGERNDG